MISRHSSTAFLQRQFGRVHHVICSNRLERKMVIFFTCFKIQQLRTISFPRAPPSKAAPSRRNIPPLVDLFMNEGNVSYCIIFGSKQSYRDRGARKTVRERIFEKPPRGVLSLASLSRLRMFLKCSLFAYEFSLMTSFDDEHIS